MVLRLTEAVFIFRTPPDGMLDVPPMVAFVNDGFNRGASKANVVARFVPFNVIVGVAIPPLAVNNPDILAVPASVRPVVIRPPRGELDTLTVPLKIVESEK